MAAPLPKIAIGGFALGSLGSGVYSTVPTLLLLYYCTEVLRIPPAFAAVIVFVPKAWALVWDPLVGAWSDRSRSPYGRRAPFILVGAIGISITFALLFNAPTTSVAKSGVYMMLVYFVMASSYSVFAVPYVAIPAEITEIAIEREQLMAWRMTTAMVGVLVGAGLAPMLVSYAGGGRQGYGTMAVVVATFCATAMLVTYAMVRRYHVSDRGHSRAPADLRNGLRRVAANRDYVRLWIAYLLAMCGTALLTAMMPYFVTHVLVRDEGDTGTVLLALLLATIGSIPLWTKALRRWGGWRALSAACATYAAIAAVFALMPRGVSFSTVLAVAVVLGVPFGGIQLLPFTLLAHIAHAEAASGDRQEGLFTGVWTAGEKLALAIGPALAGGGLAMAGYVSGVAQQSAGALKGIQFLMALGPALFLLPAMLLLIARRDAPHAVPVAS
jgi:glycoside/pentoside/hexuronide:cation symporter, GPH family